MNKHIYVIGAGVGGLTTASLLVKNGYSVTVFEKMRKLGGRTTSTIFRNHILDNGFHIMPFYKKSAIYEVLKTLGIESKLNLAKVDKIAFYSDAKFHKYPKGIGDLLQLSLLPFSSRIKLLKVLLPMAFASMKKTEEWDNLSLTEITKKLDSNTNAFFEAVCMLAFADTADHISLGEFARTMIRANPFKGGTSEFAYPNDGGYDVISRVLGDYIIANKGKIHLNSPIQRIVVNNSRVQGVVTKDETFHPSECVVISLPAYQGINHLFDNGVFDQKFVDKVNKLDKTTAVVEVHFALNKKIDSRQIVFPVGDFTTKGFFFVSNITPSVCPSGEHLMIAGTPVCPSVAENPKKIKEIVGKMKNELSSIYPDFKKSLLWDRPMAWKLVESVVKKPGLVWKSKMPHEISQVRGLYFVGDSTISYGIGTDSAAHSSILCYPKIENFLKRSN
ncbi:MAG: FAD-dependent oxidoreductase [Nitrosopumilus sp.]|nr:FAD-dependent oxidoreductase [Nitrosopumilus sp.]MDH3340675.1 FAD-dependent oxidoreductase [Nitrosopumilus sp.]